MVQAAIALGIIGAVLSLVVLLFLGNILLDVVDAVYFCYAMDLDSQRVTRQDIHDVISKVRPSSQRPALPPSPALASGCSCIHICLRNRKFSYCWGAALVTRNRGEGDWGCVCFT